MLYQNYRLSFIFEHSEQISKPAPIQPAKSLFFILRGGIFVLLLWVNLSDFFCFIW